MASRKVSRLDTVLLCFFWEEGGVAGALLVGVVVLGGEVGVVAAEAFPVFKDGVEGEGAQGGEGALPEVGEAVGVEGVDVEDYAAQGAEDFVEGGEGADNFGGDHVGDHVVVGGEDDDVEDLEGGDEEGEEGDGDVGLGLAELGEEAEGLGDVVG